LGDESGLGRRLVGGAVGVFVLCCRLCHSFGRLLFRSDFASRLRIFPLHLSLAGNSLELRFDPALSLLDKKEFNLQKQRRLIF
jgi:hypothetical protein